MGKKGQTLQMDLVHDTTSGKRGQIKIIGTPVKDCYSNAEY